jgi:hypothetical protein
MDESILALFHVILTGIGQNIEWSILRNYDIYVACLFVLWLSNVGTNSRFQNF